MQDNFNIIEPTDNINEEINITDNVETKSFDQVTEIFNSEKGGATIEKELKEFQDYSENEQQEINKKLDENIGFDLDELNEEESTFENIISDNKIKENEEENEEENNIENQQELEDYFSSAEFLIFILELIIVWGTNFHLKRKHLDKITIDAFKKSQRETKLLVRAFAKILQKYNKQITVEMELAFCLITTYGMKVRNIIKEQENKKDLEIKNKVPTKRPRIKSKKSFIKDDILKEEIIEEKTDIKTIVKKDEKIGNKGKQIDWRLSTDSDQLPKN